MKAGTVQTEIEEFHVATNKTGKKQLALCTKLEWLQTDANTTCQKPWRWCRAESNQKQISFETSHEWSSLFYAHRLWPVRAAGAAAAANFQLINEATAAAR